MKIHYQGKIRETKYSWEVYQWPGRSLHWTRWQRPKCRGPAEHAVRIPPRGITTWAFPLGPTYSADISRNCTLCLHIKIRTSHVVKGMKRQMVATIGRNPRCCPSYLPSQLHSPWIRIHSFTTTIVIVNLNFLYLVGALQWERFTKDIGVLTVLANGLRHMLISPFLILNCWNTTFFLMQ